MTSTLCASFGDILRAIFSGLKKEPICNGKGPWPRVPSAMLFTGMATPQGLVLQT